MSSDWSYDSEYDKTSLGKYYLSQFYFHLQTFANPLKGKTNIFESNKIKCPKPLSKKQELLF